MRLQTGYTLVEMIAVVAILGIIAVVSIPSSEPANSSQLDHTVAEFAEAVRFARSEAMRTSNPHGVYISGSAKEIRVYRADMSTSLPTPVYDVYHPVSKKLYQINVDDLSHARVDAITQSSNYQGACLAPEHILFNQQGFAFCRNPVTVPYVNGSVTFTLANDSRVMHITGASGRVTVQE